MTSLDDLPFLQGEPSPPTNAGVRPRPHRHRWGDELVDVVDMGPSADLGRFAYVTVPGKVCQICNATRDETRARRGKQSRNYGNRAELDVARRYGGRKVGHAQGPTDVMGVSRKIQVKTSRRSVPPMWAREFAKLDSEADGRLAVLLLRFVRAGNLGPDDYFVVRAADFIAWYGPDD